MRADHLSAVKEETVHQGGKSSAAAPETSGDLIISIVFRHSSFPPRLYRYFYM